MIPPDLQKELSAHNFVCGSDEVGYGSWAGPTTVCAVVVSNTWTCPGVTDSKKLTTAAREKLFPKLVSLTHHLVHVEADEIDRRGIGVVLPEAHSRAIQGALDAHKAHGYTDPPLVIIDGSRGVFGAIALPKADLLIPAVSAASIIAKVTRDRIMREMDSKYPGYGFLTGVGYGTKKHQEALEILGPSPIHRMSYSPMKELAVGRELWMMMGNE
jgi:ribonuclease HII